MLGQTRTASTANAELLCLPQLWKMEVVEEDPTLDPLSHMLLLAWFSFWHLLSPSLSSLVFLWFILHPGPKMMCLKYRAFPSVCFSPGHQWLAIHLHPTTVERWTLFLTFVPFFPHPSPVFLVFSSLPLFLFNLPLQYPWPLHTTW